MNGNLMVPAWIGVLVAVAAAHLSGCGALSKPPGRLVHESADIRIREKYLIVGGTRDKVLQITFANGHRLTFDIERMRICGWLGAGGKIQLSLPTGYGNPLWMVDAERKAINIGDYRGKAKWLGYEVVGKSVTLRWQIPLRDKTFATVEETYSPTSKDIYGTRYDGLKRQVWITVPKHHLVSKVGLDNAYGVNGSCDGHVTYNLNHGTSLQVIEWRSDKPTATTRAAWGYSPRLTMGAMGQPFIFADHDKGNLIIYPDSLDYAWSAYLQNHQARGEDGIWPSFEIIVGEKSRRFYVGGINYIFSADRSKGTPQRWLDALTFTSNYFCGIYGLDNHRFSVHTRHLDLMYEMRANWTNWYDGPTLAEKYAVWLKERGCDAVFIDIWKYIQRVKSGDHELYTSCSVDVLEVTEDFGGEKGLKEFCDIMRRHGIKVLLWVNFQYITAGGMSQVDGGRGSSLLREHPEWRLLDREGNTRGRGLTVMSFASGWKEYLVSRLKHLKDACGVAGYYVDNSAGAVRRIDYGVEPPSGMMAHYWDIVHQLQAHGLIMMFEETGGVTINGGAGYMWRGSMTMDGTEWGLTKGAPTGVHAQTDRQRGLLHQNASGLHTLRRLTGGDAQQAKHMRTLLDKHGGLPDRIRLVNLRRKDGGRGWAYDNTDWVYADKTVPYKIIHTYQASKFEVKRGKVTAGKPEMLFQPDKGHLGIRAAKENDGREIVWLAEVNVKDSPDLVDLLKVQFDARYSSSCRQTVELYNYTAGKWEEVDSRTVKRNGPGFRWSRYDTGGHYVSGKGKIRLRVHATSSRPFVCRLENLRVTIDQGTGLRHRILARRNKTKTSPPLTIAVGGKARALKSPPLPFKPTTRPRLARPAARKLKSTKALIAKLRAPAMQDRASAAHELGLKGDVKAAGALIEAMKDKEWRVRDRAAEALYKLQDPSAVPVLVDAIRDPAWRVRFWAIKGLGKLKADIAVLRLIGALEDEHQGVIEHAARALAQIKHPAGFVALTEALKSKRVDVRHSAVGAFGLWGGDEAAGVLSEALSDEERGVRLRVVDSLARIGTPACADALVAALEDESDRVRRRAIPAIAAIGDKRAIPILEALLVGGYHQTRAAARAGIKRLGSDPVPYVLKAAENPKAKGGGEAVEARYAAYVKLKAHIATALGETGDKRAVPKLQELLKDKDREVKRAAQRALRKIKSK